MLTTPPFERFLYPLVILFSIAFASCTDGATTRGSGDGPSNGDSDPQTSEYCGDKQLSGFELCDGPLFAIGRPCADYGLGVGEVSCTARCTLDFSDCEHDDMCEVKGWYGDKSTCHDCEAVGGEPDQDCAEGCGADGNCVDSFSEMSGSWTCERVVGHRDPDCPECGNQTLDEGELCDGDEFMPNRSQCVDYGFGGGTLGCNQCTPDFSACTTELCGNFIVEGEEECDGWSVGGQTCKALGFFDGRLRCRECEYDTTGCIERGAASFENYIEARCARAERCSAQWGRRYVSEASCVSNELASRECWPQAPHEQEVVDTCTAWLETDTCTSPEPPVCDMTRYGWTIANAGEECGGSCEDGYFCGWKGVSGACPVCQARAGEGEACATDHSGDLVPCRSGLYCNNDIHQCEPLKGVGLECESWRECSTFLCKAGKCAARIPAGASCESGDLCEVWYHVCLDGKCAERPTLGESCTSYSGCLRPAWCVDGVCVERDVCAYRKLDEPCGSSAPCADGLHCDYDSSPYLCKAILSLGAQCTSEDFCGFQNYCDEIDGRCRRRVPVGGSCERGHLCAFRTKCDSVTKRCRPLLAVGEDCHQDGDCQTWWCDNESKKCAQRPLCPGF